MTYIPTLAANPSLANLSTYLPDIPFSSADGRTLRLQLLKPDWAGAERRCPLIVFVQGSAWHHPNAHRRLPILASFSIEGYVVASVEHRSREEGPFPAFLEDVKTAIRFLREKASEYGIDPERICVWGTSSGGNAALLTGMTTEEYHTSEWSEHSSRVQAVIDCFGPADIPVLIDESYPQAWTAQNTPFDELNGGPISDGIERLLAMSPTRLIRPGLDLPPFLLMHGDADDVVGFSQSERCHERLLACGYDSTLYRVVGAPHEGSFWSPALLDVARGFLRRVLG